MRLFFVELPDSVDDYTLRSLFDAVDEETRTRAKRFRLRDDCLRCLVGRLFISWYLRTQSRIPKTEFVEIKRTAQGRPFLIHPISQPTLDYNISHDGRMVLLGASQGSEARVGVDVVKVVNDAAESRDLEEALEDQLHLSERTYLRSLQTGRSEALARVWATKEAYTKALGHGLGFEFSRIAVSPNNDTLTVDECAATDDWSFQSGTFDDKAGQAYVWATASRHQGLKEAVAMEEVDWQSFLDCVTHEETG